jgi:predicted HAD superfamily hydrolase
MLAKAGVEGWDRLFVSNAEGVRKDSGQLYELVRQSYHIQPEDLVMLGDNERSDIQIPWEQGTRGVPVLRPVEMARGNPRLSKLVDEIEKQADLDEALSLGQVILHKNWGYSLVGPLLVSFSQWLCEQARADGIDSLYFLSREGKMMKAVYDAWVEGLPGAPRSHYLVLSRRSSSMAALSSFEEILDIARTLYFPNTFGKLQQTRYGISPCQKNGSFAA